MFLYGGIMAGYKRSEATVQKILDVSLKLFLEKGYEETTILDIVDSWVVWQEVLFIIILNQWCADSTSWDLSAYWLTRAVEEGKELEKQKEEEREVVNDYIVEPSAEQLIADLIPTVLSQKLFTAAVDSNASEHAARTLAMQVATDNANELIQDLTKQYNKSRQQAITKRIAGYCRGFHEVINHLSFVLKQKKEAKKNSRLTFFSYSLPSLR